MIEHIPKYFEYISAACLGAGDPSEGFDLSGLIHALTEEFYGLHGKLWRLDFSEILIDIHSVGWSWPQWTSTCPERLTSWIASLLEVFTFFKKDVTETDICLFVGKYSLAALGDLGEDFLKYQTNWLACRLLHQTEYPTRPQQLPEGEVDGFLFPSLHRWLLHRCRSAVGRLQLGYSLIQFKRGCKPVSVIKRFKALAKHAKNLGRPGKSKQELSTLVREVKRTIREVLGEKSPGDFERLLPPSTSAHHEHRRADYGALPYIRTCVGLSSECDLHTGLTYSIFDCACNKWQILEEPQTEHARWGSISSACYYAVMRGGPLMSTPFVPAVSVGWTGPSYISEDLKKEALETGFWNSDFRHEVSDVHLVLEPFKVRTITAGSPLFGWIGRFWQKVIHARFGQHPMFEYTHAPVSFESIRAAFGSVPSEHYLVSGDYEAATDNIEMELTKAAWEACCEWLYKDHDERVYAYQLGCAMLSEQVLDYSGSIANLLEYKDYASIPDDVVGRIRDRFGVVAQQEQRQGQLMGCILSFFILCGINGACARKAFEDFHGRKFRLHEIPVKINGDDILFNGPMELIERWKEVSLSAGLKPSLGKNFVSKEFAMINSEMYRFERTELRVESALHSDWYAVGDDDVGYDEDFLTEDFRSWKKFRHWMANELALPIDALPVTTTYGDGSLTCHYIIVPPKLRPVEFLPYLNLGLLTGSGRVQSDTRQTAKFIFGDDRTESVGSRARALVKGFSATKGKALIERFVELNNDALRSTTRAWGLPEALGGLGIPYITNHSTSGLVVAAFLDRADPATYCREMSAIKGVDLNPPPHVRHALSLITRIQKEYGTKVWGAEADAKQYELPLLVGATFLMRDLDQKEARRTGNPEKAYLRLVRTATNSGVRKMTEERLGEIGDKVVFTKLDLRIKTLMEACIPSINHRITGALGTGQFVEGC